MATREIKTLITLDGEKEFRRDLEAAGRELRVLGSELKAAAAEFEDTGDKQQWLTRKSAILSKELEQQEEIVKELENALKTVTDAFGEGSKQADGYTIKLNNARAKAEKMRKELKQTERELSDVGNEMDDTTKDTKQLARALKDELEDGAREAKSSLEELTDSLNDLKNMKGIQLGIDLAENVWDALQGIMDFTNEQRPNIRENRLTEERAIAAGYDPIMIEDMVRDATAITGDLEGTRNAYGMLTAIPGMSEAWLRAWSDMFLGADLKIPELTFEALAEGLQETLSNRVLAGPFLELLERSGYTEAQVDLYNEQLRAAKTLEEAMNIVMTPLATANVVEGGGSYADFLRRYTAKNEDVIKAEAAQTKLADAQTGLAEALLPITTILNDLLADLTNELTSFIEEDLPVAFSTDPDVGFGERTRAAFGWDRFVDNLSTLGWFGLGKNAETDAMIEQAEEAAREATAANDDITDAFAYLEELMAEVVTTTKDGLENFVEEDLPVAFSTDPDVGLGDRLGAAFGWDRFVDNLSTLGWFGLGKNAETDMEEMAVQVGKDVGAGISLGIDTSTAAAVASAQAMADQVSAALHSIAVPNVGAMMQAAMAGGNMLAGAGGINVVLNGRKVGQLVTPIVSTQQARSMRT